MVSLNFIPGNAKINNTSHSFNNFNPNNSDHRLFLKKKLLDYILQRAKNKRLKHISKKDLFKIESLIEGVVDDTIESSLEVIKSEELRNTILDDEELFGTVDRYRIIKKPGEIEFHEKNEIPRAMIERNSIKDYGELLDSEELEEELSLSADEKRKRNWRWEEVILEQVSPWRLN
jgi:hypothetical protein